MRCEPKVSCSYLVMPWWMMLALLLLLIDESSSAPIPQSASELMGDDEKALTVGPGRPEDNAVLVVNDSNKLSFTMFRPSCLGSKESLKEINAEIWLENGCKMKIKWTQDNYKEEAFGIEGGGGSVTVPRSSYQAQVDLDGISLTIVPGVDKWGAAPCMLNLRKVPDGNGYLANISLRGTPECEVKAVFNYKQYEPLSSEILRACLQIRCLRLPSLGSASELWVLLLCLTHLLAALLLFPVPPNQSDQGKNKSAEPVAIVIEPPEEEVLKPKSQPKQVLKPKSQPKQVIKPKSKPKQVIKPSISEEMPKSPPMPKGVPVGIV
uniref:Uncharacterized protein n=1 Tax=Ditylenchus dipsaci TaxID=166011 RepID=A0A915D279_9BILA